MPDKGRKVVLWRVLCNPCSPILGLHCELERKMHWKDGKKPGAVAGEPVRLRFVMK